MLDAYFAAQFEGGHHQHRIEMCIRDRTMTEI